VSLRSYSTRTTGEFVTPTQSLQKPHLLSSLIKVPFVPSLTLCQYHVQLTQSPASHPHLATFISLGSHLLHPPCHSSCQVPTPMYCPVWPRLPWAQYQKLQNLSTQSHPQHDLTSISCTSLSHSLACSSSYCLTDLVWYYTTLALTLLD